MENNTVNEPSVQYNQPLNFEQVWLMFQETEKQMKANDTMIKERFQETDRVLSEKFRETERVLKEMFQQTDKKINKLEALFTSQWGKLVESLVEGDLIKLLKEKGVGVERTLQRVRGNHEGMNYEYDIIAENTTEVVIVEVKTTLRPQDVTDFHEKVWKAKTFMPKYKDMIIYGGVAFLTSEGASDRMAEKQGFFVIKATGSSSSIVNQEGFKPKAF